MGGKFDFSAILWSPASEPTGGGKRRGRRESLSFQYTQKGKAGISQSSGAFEHEKLIWTRHHSNSQIAEIPQHTVVTTAMHARTYRCSQFQGGGTQSAAAEEPLFPKPVGLGGRPREIDIIGHGRRRGRGGGGSNRKKEENAQYRVSVCLPLSLSSPTDCFD